MLKHAGCFIEHLGQYSLLVTFLSPGHRPLYLTKDKLYFIVKVILLHIEVFHVILKQKITRKKHAYLFSYALFRWKHSFQHVPRLFFHISMSGVFNTINYKFKNYLLFCTSLFNWSNSNYMLKPYHFYLGATLNLMCVPRIVFHPVTVCFFSHLKLKKLQSAWNNIQEVKALCWCENWNRY